MQVRGQDRAFRLEDTWCAFKEVITNLDNNLIYGSFDPKHDLKCIVAGCIAQMVT